MTRIAVVLALAVAIGCYSKPQKPQVEPLTFRQVQNPAEEMCRDDTLSPTGWFNVPVAVFTASTVELNGQPSSERELATWAHDYYKAKSEKALWVKISADGTVTAERALTPLIRTYPDLQLRRVDFDFRCPKTDAKYDVKRCAPKVLRTGKTPSHIHIHPNDKPTGHIPVVGFNILETGDVAGVVLKQSSGVREKDNYALLWVKGGKYNSRPGCGVIESEVGVTIDLY